MVSALLGAHLQRDRSHKGFPVHVLPVQALPLKLFRDGPRQRNGHKAHSTLDFDGWALNGSGVLSTMQSCSVVELFACYVSLVQFLASSCKIIEKFRTFTRSGDNAGARNSARL